MKKIVLFSQLEESSLNQLTKIKKHMNVADFEFHLVYCHKIQVFMNELSLYSYPGEEEFVEMKKATDNILTQFANELGLVNFQVHTFLDADPKQRCTTFLEDVDADLCVVATRGKKGLEGVFESSFANQMNKYAPCDVLVLRPH
jgi:nucleotide-binding universal stress UspA family protein